jgi:redox-sensitive bicupin YhaK (pirin superfamily)
LGNVTNKPTTNLISFNQDSNIYVSELDPGKAISFQVKANRQAYLLCVEGKLSINEGKELLEESDALEVYGDVDVNMAAPKDEKGHLLIVEMEKPVV